MCGRFTLKTPAPKLIELFRVNSLPQLHPRFNIAPTQMILCICENTDHSQRQAILMRWGLIPFWARDASIGNRMINARSETVSEKPAFRQAIQKRRCLIPADGFYEWESAGKGPKLPWLIQMSHAEPFAMAGIWETWRRKSDADLIAETGLSTDEMILSCTILTTEANNDMRPLHDRMPVILRPDDYQLWLGGDTCPKQYSQLLQPLPDGILSRFRVSTLVNRPVNDSPECILPLPEC